MARLTPAELAHIQAARARSHDPLAQVSDAHFRAPGTREALQPYPAHRPHPRRWLARQLRRHAPALLRWHIRRKTEAELYELDPRMLRDVGLCRGDIPATARDQALRAVPKAPARTAARAGLMVWPYLRLD